MNLKQLEAFVCVAETRNFSRAAKKLYLTQPTVSAHIHSLEEELGARLLIRTTKDVLLSTDGERLYQKARDILQLEREIRRDFQNLEGAEKKTVIIGASTIPGQYILPRALSLFSRHYPESQLEILENDSLGVVNMVLNEEIEVGFTGTRMDHPSCIFEGFYQDKLVIVTPNTEEYQRFESPGVFPVEQLYMERLIVREEGSGTRKEAERCLERAGIDLDRISVVATISNQEIICKSVSAGMGISIISSAAAGEYVRRGELKCFSLQEGDVYRKLYMVWNKNSKPGVTARTFIQFVRELYEV